jgi:hypothetical protein
MMEVVDPGCGAGESGARTTIEGEIQRSRRRTISTRDQGGEMINCKNVQVLPMQQWSDGIEKEKGKRKRRKTRRGRWTLFYSAGSGLSVTNYSKPSYPVYQVKKKNQSLLAYQICL